METAFPIQSATIADALAGRDVLGRARTGSGKTLGFGLPAIAVLAQSGPATPHRPRAIVLVPTRELAMQVNDALEPFAHSMHVTLRLVAGGLSMSKQIRSLERGVHLVIATPGRLADLVRQGHADLSETRIVVLDEADHMAQMGFMDEIEEIVARVPHGAQRLLFSATLDGDVDRLVATSMTDPARHDVTGGDDTNSAMSHVVLHVPPHAKYNLATRIAAREGRTIVFVRSKLGCDRIAGQMRDAGVTAVALHGDKSQAERNHAITGFRAGTIPVLVATDVAARGIHVDHVDLVMQMDPPADHKDYTHRAGRTARAGENGLVVTLALPHQRRTVEGLMDRAGVDPTITSLRGDDEASLRTLADLTGAREPSGNPVAEPRVPGAKRGRDNARGGDRGARSAKPSRGERGRRPSHSRAAEVAPTPQHEHAKARHELERRERELAAREREIALREQRLTGRGDRTVDQSEDRRGGERHGESRGTGGAPQRGSRDGGDARSREGWATRTPRARDAWAKRPGGKSRDRDRERDSEPGRERDRNQRTGAGRRDERSETRGQRSDSRGQRSDSRGQRSDSRGQRSEGRGQWSENRDQRSDSRGRRPANRSGTDRARGAARDDRAGDARGRDGATGARPSRSGEPRREQDAQGPRGRGARVDGRSSSAPSSRERGPQRRDQAGEDSRTSRRTDKAGPEREGRSESTRPEKPARSAGAFKKSGKKDKKKGKGSASSGRSGKPRPKKKR